MQRLAAVVRVSDQPTRAVCSTTVVFKSILFWFAGNVDLTQFISLVVAYTFFMAADRIDAWKMKFPVSTLRIVGSTWLRAVAVGCLALIVFLSLIPGRWQERTTLPGPLEHFVAYLFTATIIGLAIRRRHHPALVVLALAALAATLEILQFWSPGRDPGFDGFFSSTAGAFVGVLIARRATAA